MAPAAGSRYSKQALKHTNRHTHTNTHTHFLSLTASHTHSLSLPLPHTHALSHSNSHTLSLDLSLSLLTSLTLSFSLSLFLSLSLDLCPLPEHHPERGSAGRQRPLGCARHKRKGMPTRQQDQMRSHNPAAARRHGQVAAQPPVPVATQQKPGSQRLWRQFEDRLG